jgi:hypothetical protein
MVGQDLHARGRYFGKGMSVRSALVVIYNLDRSMVDWCCDLKVYAFQMRMSVGLRELIKVGLLIVASTRGLQKRHLLGLRRFFS